MNLWKSLAGMVEVELTSAEPQAALAAINARGIEIFQMRQVSNLTCCFLILRSKYRLLASLCKKRGETLRVIKKAGLYWRVKGLMGRPVLLLGLAFAFTAMLYIPSRIFFVRVEGNASVPSRKILAAAEESGINFGAFRREVRSEKVKNALLSAVPELQWAGVNTSGCVATITVRERSVTEEPPRRADVTSIVAARDGYILSATVTQGNALVREGETVREGQVLISGYTDCGICIQATQASGEIYAQTSRSLEAVTPSEYDQRGTEREVKRKYSLLIRKKRINLWKDSGISDVRCGRMYEEYYITLPGGFQLPIALCVDTYISYDVQTAPLAQWDAEKALNDFADAYLIRQMVAGRIAERFQTVTLEDGVYRLNGNYICTEMIGRVRQEQIGDTNGKSG